MAIINRAEINSLLSDEKEFSLPDDAEPLRPEPRHFAPEQMVKCAACQRANPPTRAACLYCGAPLPQTEGRAAMQTPALRKLEEWEKGFNVILLPNSRAGLSHESFAEAARLLRLKPEDLSGIIDANVPLPLARAATNDEAQLVKDRLAQIGLSALVIGDGDLGTDDSTRKRARGLEFSDSGLALRSAVSGEAIQVVWSEISLLVAGRLFLRRVEVEERGGGKAEKEIVAARELGADEAVLDIYTSQSGDCWRITSGSFDFSCLGASKGLLAAQNFQTLAKVLRERATQAFYDDSYQRVRQALAAVWPVDEQTEAGGRRRRAGRVNTEAVTKSSNETQFTRYSRLRRYLNVHHTRPDA